MADADFGDFLDYLATDAASRAILLYMESVTNAPKFMSAARRAARAKPVIVVKAGRGAAGAKAALSHTGALAGADSAYEAAFRRAGVLRVRELDDLFSAAEILARHPRIVGDRLAILTNGGGAGVLAADRLGDLQRPAREPLRGDAIGARRRPAADLVARQSGRHHRRRRPGEVRARPRRAAARRRHRRHPGHELPDRARLRHDGRAGDRGGAAAAHGRRRSRPSRSLRAGSATRRAARPASCLPPRASRASPRRPRPSTGSRSSCATRARRKS